MRIAELMTDSVISCSMHEMSHAAARQMWEQDIGCLPVTDDEGRVAGVVTDRDIAMAAYTQGKAPQEIPVSDIMTKGVVTCRPSDTVDTADRMMAERQVRRIPIVDDQNRPIGFLSMNDITRGAATGRTDGVDAREVVRSLSAIGQPRGGPGRGPHHPSAA